MQQKEISFYEFRTGEKLFQSRVMDDFSSDVLNDREPRRKRLTPVSWSYRGNYSTFVHHSRFKFIELLNLIIQHKSIRTLKTKTTV